MPEHAETSANIRLTPADVALLREALHHLRWGGRDDQVNDLDRRLAALQFDLRFIGLAGNSEAPRSS